MLIVAIGMLAAGQVAKFDSRQPELDYTSSARLEDVERCLIRWAAPPMVYRQPDRPDEVSIVWAGVGLSAGTAAARVDLKKDAAGTHVRSWQLTSQVQECAPK